MNKSNIIFTKESLLKQVDGVKNSGDFPLVYDSNDPVTRKQVGRVVDVWYDGDDNGLYYTMEGNDGKFSRGRAK